MSSTAIAELVSSRLRDIPDFPVPGVVFKDVTPLLADGDAFGDLVRDMAQRWRGRVDVVVGIEARGFIFGGALAHELGIGFVPVRKAGKLPGRTLGVSYDLEYGSARIELHADSFVGGERVLLVDDVLATGGTLAAAADLVGRAGGQLVGVSVVVELTALGGRDRLADLDVQTVLTG
jgi:adenine phosphoribosyltransferase